ncbi:hypothetical protein C1646_777669 [Rhizophagus diaphanus]|nr:hypothetical protein C1646_777669 [Rhizophagus diaphanus] [Rhizophagus sp. MUCL 43196]
MVLNQFFAHEIIELKQLAKLKQQKKWKMIYVYDNMTDQNWLNYKEKTAKLFDDKDLSMSKNVNDLNKKWLNFRKKLINLTLQSRDGINSRDTLIKKRRVIVTEDNEDILKTVPECIKKEVDHYSPKAYIDSTIYDRLMDQITQKEGDYHISLLSNGKASGPSRIFYKMIKHSSVKMKLFITNYLNECLALRKIPKE